MYSHNHIDFRSDQINPPKSYISGDRSTGMVSVTKHSELKERVTSLEMKCTNLFTLDVRNHLEYSQLISTLNKHNMKEN